MSLDFVGSSLIEPELAAVAVAPAKKKAVKKKAAKPKKAKVVDNLDVRFNAIYNIISKSWVQNYFVQKESDEDFTPSDENRYIKNLAKKTR